MRKFASIQEVKSVYGHPTNPNLEIVEVLGWKSVVLKGVFSPGDKCVYFEMDSVLPSLSYDIPECFEQALALSTKLNVHFVAPSDVDTRVRTVLIDGVESQGLVAKLNPEYKFQEVGTDLSEILGIHHYHIPDDKDFSGEWPPGLPKTEEPNVQANPDILRELEGIPAVATLKMDGTSATYFCVNGGFGVCSRNKNAGLNSNPWGSVAKELKIDEKMKSLGRNLAIQGEICGGGLQGNKLKLKKKEFYVFSVFDIDAGSYIPYVDAKRLVLELGLQFVPEVCVWENGFPKMSVDDALNLSRGEYSVGGPREGIVIRPMLKEYMFNPVEPKRLTFKVKNPDFLIAYKE